MERAVRRQLESRPTVLHVRDTGPGPAAGGGRPPVRAFVSGKPEGTGLGLYVARQIAEDHHGSIRWQREGDTTCFTVELPLSFKPDRQTHRSHVNRV